MLAKACRLSEPTSGPLIRFWADDNCVAWASLADNGYIPDRRAPHRTTPCLALAVTPPTAYAALASSFVLHFEIVSP